MDEPFQRIALDFVGPLPMTDSKNRFILVCVDYATKYPEAIALRDQEASTVSNALISLFSRVGIPFGTSLYANSKYGIYSSHVLGFDLAYAFNIVISTPLNFSQSPFHIAW
jgi:hypothetical protein